MRLSALRILAARRAAGPPHPESSPGSATSLRRAPQGRCRPPIREDRDRRQRTGRPRHHTGEAGIRYPWRVELELLELVTQQLRDGAVGAAGVAGHTPPARAPDGRQKQGWRSRGNALSAVGSSAHRCRAGVMLLTCRPTRGATNVGRQHCTSTGWVQGAGSTTCRRSSGVVSSTPCCSCRCGTTWRQPVFCSPAAIPLTATRSTRRQAACAPSRSSCRSSCSARSCTADRAST